MYLLIGHSTESYDLSSRFEQSRHHITDAYRAAREYLSRPRRTVTIYAIEKRSRYSRATHRRKVVTITSENAETMWNR